MTDRPATPPARMIVRTLDGETLTGDSLIGTSWVRDDDAAALTAEHMVGADGKVLTLIVDGRTRHVRTNVIAWVEFETG